MSKTVRRILIGVLGFALVFSGIIVAVLGRTTTVKAYSDAKPLPTLTGDKKIDFINIAKSQEGYKEDSDGSTVYGKWYTDYKKDSTDYTKLSWCAMYISWCAQKAGIGEDVVPYTSMCKVSADFYKKANLWNDASGYTPKPGDIAYFVYGDANEPNHMGIVAEVNSTTSGTRVTTYEGNKSSLGGAVGSSTYNSTDKSIVGYATPKYTTGSVSTVKPTATATTKPTATATASPSPSATVTPVAVKYNQPSKTLKVGDKGDDVKWMQYCLKKMGYSLKADGLFGSGTQSVLKQAQRKLGIYADGTLGKGTVNAIKKNINISSAFIVVDTKTDSVVTFDKVSGFKVTQNTYNSIKLSWTKVNNARGYVVVRYNTKTKKYDSLKATSLNYYIDKNLNPGSTYKYKIRAYKRVGDYNVYGMFSSVVSCVARPVTVNAKLQSYGSRAIKLSWTSQSDVTGYQVYRKDSASRSYKLRKTITNNKTNYFVNTGLTKGRTYYYKVRSYKTVNGKKVYGAYSTVRSMKIK